MKDSVKYGITLFVVFFSIIWVPLQRVLIQIDGAGRLSFFFAVVSVVINYNEIRRLCFRKPISYYLLLTLYMMISGFLVGSQNLYGSGSSGVFVMIEHIFMAPIIMLLMVCLVTYKYDKTIKVIVFALLFYGIFAVVSGIGNLSDERLDSAVANANEVVLMVAMGFSLAIVLFVREQINLLFFLALEAFFLLVVLLTGSRMGAVMVFIVVLLSILFLRKKHNFRSTFGTLILLSVFFLLVIFVLNNTLVGERMLGTSTELEEMSLQTGTFLDVIGDRGVQYYLSWPYFLQHPIFGIGFHQWRLYSPWDLVAHSEYMAQYVEDGIVGFVVYMLFFAGIVIMLVKALKNAVEDNNRKTVKILVATMAAIAFGNFVLWTYDCLGVFAVYGIVHATTIQLNDPRINK